MQKQKKNIDGLSKPAQARLNKPLFAKPAIFVKVDGIVRLPAKSIRKKIAAPVLSARQTSAGAVVKSRHFSAVKKSSAIFFSFVKACKPYVLFWTEPKLSFRKLIPALGFAMALLLAFSGGMLAELSTPKTEAVDQQTQSDPGNFAVVMPDANLGSQGNNSLSNEILFNTPIEYLKNYLADVAQPDVLAKRKAQLTAYLTARKSPLVSAADTIAEQPHWQLILAIAFAESTLGRNCADNNCSNIGVKPGALSWRRYGDYQSWVVDFNRLLDNKRYKNMTLEQMCGVYVKPCNPNWLAATRQILGELKDQNVE